MQGPERRFFQAEMARKYGGGSPRPAEVVFGGNRHAVAGGLHAKRTGLICLGGHEAFCGNKLGEERHPKVAEALWALAESHAQQDPSFRTPLSYTRLTAAEALRHLRDQGFAQDVLPAPGTMADVLKRHGYRLRPVVKAKPQKKFPKPTPSSPISTPRTRAPLGTRSCGWA